MKQSALKRLSSLAVLLFLSMQLLSQNEAAKWYFGNHCGLDFSTNPPSPLPSPSIVGGEGCAAISDAAGNALFYTEGENIWDQSHAVMANGSGLLGNQSSTQSALIVKQPGNSSIYFVFTQGANVSGLSYSVVDMSLAAGMGSVTVKNVPLYSPSCEKICGAVHCNGTDIWVLSHAPLTNVFYSHLVTAAGISAVPVSSAVGSNASNYTVGALKISPNGRKVAMNRVNDNTIELFDFNNSTGAVSNPLTLISNYLAPYGCEFSPDSKKLYAGKLFSNHVLQWDLCQASNAAIITSSVALPLIASSTPVGSMQLAPNGKIYITHGNLPSLTVINDPDVAGAGCNLSYAGQPIGTGTTTLGLPNFVSSYFKLPPAFAFTQSCSVVSFTAPVFGCSAAENYTAVAWSFKDPASGTQSISSQPVATHAFSSAGTYTVRLILYSECRQDSVFNVFNIPAAANVAVAGNTLVCAGKSATLLASGADSYNWGAGLPASSVIAVSPGTTTSYTVTGSYTNGCVSNNAVVTVSVLPAPELAVTGQSICIGQTATLTATGAVSYSWSTGETGQEINVAPNSSTSYVVAGTATNGCTKASTVQVIIKPNPVLTMANATVCAGETKTLSANITPAAGLSYLWQPGGATTPSIVITPAATGIYTLTATLAGCTASAAGLVTVRSTAAPLTDFSYKTPVCVNSGDLPLLRAPGAQGGDFTTEAGLKVDIASGLVDFTGSFPGAYVVTYSVAAKDCIAAGTSTASVVIEPVPALTVSPDVKIISGTSITLSVSATAPYSWVQTPGISCTDCANPVVSPVENTQYCVVADNTACKAKACVNVQVTCEGGDLSLPNAFSPNGDGYNDEYCLQGWNVCVNKFSVLIFSRWGEKVFESNDPSFCWDGSFKGKVLEQDVVIYMITATFNNGNSISKKGNITLLR